MRKAEQETNVMKSPFKYLVYRALNTYSYAIVICLLPLVVGARFFGDLGTAALISAVGMPVLFILTYCTFWGTAERDRNLVLFGHMKEDKLRALRAACYTMIPLAILTLLAVINAYAGGFMPDWFTLVYRVIAMPFMLFVRLALDSPGPFSWLLILICGWTPLAAWYGYRNGYTLVRLLDRLVYRQKPRDRDKRLR